MAYLYIDDGYPESQDYENNYIYFDARDPECTQKMLKLIQALATLSPQRKKMMLNKLNFDHKSLASH